MYKKILIFFFIIMLFSSTVKATDAIIESQLDALNLSSFIKEGEKYTKNIFKDINMEEVLRSAISGDINAKNMNSSILGLLGDEIVSSVTIMGGILAIIVIHAILRNIAENIGKNSISQVAYYVEYILIVTLVMTSFTNVMDLVRTTITNLVGYINILIPLLLALVMTTGTAVTASVMQPVILGVIIFVGNGITLYFLPILLIATVLGIVSNLSDKIQIGKLSKMLKTSIVWVLGFVLTMFVSILSLEGTLTSGVDGLTIKGLKTASSTFIPVVGKVLGDSVDTVLRCNICYKKCSRSSRYNSYSRNMCDSYYKTNSTNLTIQFFSSSIRTISR